MGASEGNRGDFEPFADGYQANTPQAEAHSGSMAQPVRVPERSVFEIVKSDAIKHKKELLILAAALFAASAFFMTSLIKEFILMIAFIGIGAASRAWQRFFPVAFGVELVMLFTVVSGMVYGPVAGLIVGFLSLSISTLATQEDIGKMWPAFLAIAVTGYIAGAISISNIAVAGLWLTVLYDVIISAVYIASGHSIVKTLIFDATHIAFNYFVFFHVAPALLSAVA